MNHSKLVAGFFVTLCQPSFAVFPFLMETDGSSAFTAGSYTGDGTVQASVTAGNFNDDGLNNSKIVDGLTSGQLSFNTDVSGSRVSPTLSTVIDVSFTGASGDLYVANSAAFDGGNDKFNSVGLSGLAGVTSISFTVSYNEYVAGRDSSLGDAGSRPLLAALGLVSTGTGVGLSNFEVAMSYSDTHYSNEGGTFYGGGPGVDSVSSAGWDTVTGDGLDYNASAFAGTIGLGDTSTNFLLVRGFDFDGDGHDGDDAERFYAKTQTWTITPDGVASFSEDTAFTFSLDGKQYSNLGTVPEASVSILSVLGGMMALGYRRRTSA